MRKFWNFLQYHNAVPIGLFILFGTGGIALAATPEVQQAVYSSTDEVKGVDNTYLISTDLSKYDFGLQITGITEDDDNYYVAYAYKTITIVDYVWKQADVSKTLTLSKKEVEGHDLGLMVQKQLGEDMKAEIAYLSEAQEKERKTGASVRTVTTTYSGLIGARLDPTTKEFPGYVPQVKEESLLPPDLSAALAAANPNGQTSHIALPPSPSQSDIEKLVQDAVANALAGAQNQNASSTAVATNTPPSDSNNNPPPSSGDTNSPPDTGSSGGSSGGSGDTSTTTPPADTGTGTTTQSTPPTDTGSSTPQTLPADTPPADTGSSTSQTPPPATDSSSTPTTPPADTGSSTPQS